VTKNLIRHAIITECENTADDSTNQLTITGKLPLYQILYSVKMHICYR
jgi:hypothetical protein